MLCKDCVACVDDLKRNNVPFEFCDFSDSLLHLKEFLKLRDSLPIFDDAKNNGYIGIPCIVEEDGEVTLDWNKYVTQA